MSKMFPKLTQTMVSIGIGNDKCIDVPMLSIAQIGELNDLRTKLSNCKTDEDFIVLRRQMISLAATCLPAEYANGLERFPLEKMVELLCYLAYGDPDDDDQPTTTAKKN